MPGRKSRHFGNIRKLPSGRYQARYRGPDGRMRSAPSTFGRKTDAALWLSLKQAEIARDDWIAPEIARQDFADYAEQWLRDRVLKVRTLELYRGLLGNHLLPTFGTMAMGEIDEAAVRRWRKERLEAGKTAQRPFGPVTVAKAYRLLHAIFSTAADQDRIIRRNPCSIDGAGKEDSHEREIVPLPVVFPIASKVRSDTGRWSCWPHSRTCDGVNWPGSGARTSTWPRARSASWRPWPSRTREACGRRRRNPVPDAAPSRSPPAGARAAVAPGTVRGAGGAGLCLRRAEGRPVEAVELPAYLAQRPHGGEPAGLAFS